MNLEQPVPYSRGGDVALGDHVGKIVDVRTAIGSTYGELVRVVEVAGEPGLIVDSRGSLNALTGDVVIPWHAVISYTVLDPQPARHPAL